MEQPPSPFFSFHTSLAFIDVYRRSTRQKVYKFELFADYSDDPHALMLISTHQHPDFEFVQNPIRKHEAATFADSMKGHAV